MNVLGLAVQTGNVSNLGPRALCSSFEEEGLGHPNLGRPYSETFPNVKLESNAMFNVRHHNQHANEWEKICNPTSKFGHEFHCCVPN